MDGSLFIAKRIRNKGRIAMIVIAVSFFVMIISIAVSSGFRQEIRQGLTSMGGDIQLSTIRMDYLDEKSPVSTDQSYIADISEMDEVEGIEPVVYRAGIAKTADNIYGVLLKGISGTAFERTGVNIDDSLQLAVAIPSSLSEVSGLEVGDRMLTYFVGEKVKARQFVISQIYEPLLKTDDRYLIYADIDDMRRLNGWSDTDASMLEVILKDDSKDIGEIDDIAGEMGALIYAGADESDDDLIAYSVSSRYPQIFDWLNLIDFNVFFIIVLMVIVAGVNMISGLLILIFENISMIGLLKSLGMRDRSIAKVFLASSSVLVLKGMAVGNILAVAFCAVQNVTHFLRLNPENYFLSFVPCHLDFGSILIYDVAAFVAIMLLLLIPSLYISRIDPAETVRMK